MEHGRKTLVERPQLLAGDGFDVVVGVEDDGLVKSLGGVAAGDGATSDTHPRTVLQNERDRVLVMNAVDRREGEVDVVAEDDGGQRPLMADPPDGRDPDRTVHRPVLDHREQVGVLLDARDRGERLLEVAAARSFHEVDVGRLPVAGFPVMQMTLRLVDEVMRASMRESMDVVRDCIELRLKCFNHPFQHRFEQCAFLLR